MRVSRRAAVWGVVLMAMCHAGEAGQATRSTRQASRSQAALKPCPQVAMEGAVAAGQSFRKTFGRGLEFVLEARPNGWIARVLPVAESRSREDFAEVATPPFQSINPLLLTTEYGFRAQDIVGWNPRSFHFVARVADFGEAQLAYRAATSSRHPTAEQDAAVTHVVMKALEGQLRILDAVMTPGTGDQSRAAGLVSTHLDTTAYTVSPPANGVADRLGKVVSMRFRVTLSAPGRVFCDGIVDSAKKP